MWSIFRFLDIFFDLGPGIPSIKNRTKAISTKKNTMYFSEKYYFGSFIDNYLYASKDTQHSHLRFCPNEMRPTATSLEATIGLLHSFKAVKWNRLTATEGSS